MSFFANVEQVPGDPILGLTEAYNADPRPTKVNLGVGIYYDEDGRIPLLRAVQLIEQQLAAEAKPRGYLPIDGLPAYTQATQKLVFGEGSELIASGRVATAQTIGGSGALRVGADLLHRLLPHATVAISNPSWENHRAVFGAAGFEVVDYTYFDNASHGLDFAGMIADLQKLQPGTVVLLHACCHNPTGFDLSHDDWHRVLDVVRRRELLPLIDFAYQGFGDGLEDDAWAVRLFAEALPEVLVTSSCSKNFGLYRERTGGLIVVAAGHEQLLDVRSQLAALARGLWSTPPAHGAAVVATILADEPLRQIWQNEVESMRRRIASLRQGLVEALTPYGLAGRFAHIAEQRGMFSYTGLSAEQVRRLRAEDAVYLLETGRANVAGLDAERLDQLAQAIARVVQG